MQTMAKSREPRAIGVEFTDDGLVVRLEGGEAIEVALAWLPWLRDASEGERARWRLIGGGIAISWPLLGQDVTTRALVRLAADRRRREE